MKQGFSLFFLILFIVLISCRGDLDKTSIALTSSDADVRHLVVSLPIPSSKTDPLHDFYLSYRERHPTRAKTLDQIKVFYGDDYICEDSDNCSYLCDRLFYYDFDKKDCKKLPNSLIQRFKFIYTIIQKRTFHRFKEINSFDLKVFLGFSLVPLVELFKEFGFSSAKSFLKELASDWELAQIFAEEDLDFILLKTLLNEIAIKPISALEESMENGKTFQEIALIKQNDFALSLIHNFFKKLCKGKKECILNHYCLVSKNYEKDTLLALNQFKDLKDILTKQTLQSFCMT